MPGPLVLFCRRKVPTRGELTPCDASPSWLARTMPCRGVVDLFAPFRLASASEHSLAQVTKASDEPIAVRLRTVLPHR